MALLYGYAGTYASPEAPGTYRFTLDTQAGTLSDPVLLYPQANTKYAAWDDGLLATFTEQDHRAGAALLDLSSPDQAPDTSLTEKVTACFMTWHEHLLYCANYHDGHVLVYRPENGKLQLIHRLFVEEEAGCHQVLFHGRYLLVPCLCKDQIRIFDPENHDALVGVLDFPKGTGPRHGVFNADHSRFYLVSETSNQLFTYRVSGLEFRQEHCISLLPENVPATQAAAIRLSEDEKTLYVSLRGSSLLTAVRVEDGVPTVMQQISSLGKDPWDLVLVPGTCWMLVSNRKTSEILCFRILDNGTIGPCCSRISVPQCVGLTLERR